MIKYPFREKKDIDDFILSSKNLSKEPTKFLDSSEMV